jgi:hypothetical protein
MLIGETEEFDTEPCVSAAELSSGKIHYSLRPVDCMFV